MRWKRWVVAGLALCAASPGVAQSGAAARSFPDTRDHILIFTDQLPGAASLTEAQWRFIATHYVGTQKELVSWTRHIHTLNPKFITLHYQLAVGAGTSAFIEGDQWTNDFDLVTTHADWFLRDDSGSRISQNAYPWKVMDIRFRNGVPQSGWPDYWVSTATRRMRANQNDGVFADSATIDILFGQVTPPYRWFNDITACKNDWITSLDQYGTYCTNALHAQPEKFTYLPNLGGLITGWDTTDYGFGDGGMNEGFALSHSGEYYAPDDWKLQMNRLLTLNRAGKILICQSYIQDRALDDRWFVVGSYLLIKGHKTYLNMFAGSTLSWYPEYAVALGPYREEPAADVSAYWQAAWGVYRRDYQHGFVLVNPSAAPVRISALGGTYKLVGTQGGGPVPATGEAPGTLTTTSVTSVLIPAHSARVLLK
jgi:hypothetical protein